MNHSKVKMGSRVTINIKITFSQKKNGSLFKFHNEKNMPITFQENMLPDSHLQII